jgi:inosine-uridine nucleoside N-ribohydrolase
MKKIIASSITLIGLLLIFAFKPGDKNERGQLNVFFETDMGNDVDDALALCMLYEYADMGNIHLLGISSNKEGRYSTEFIDVLNTWFGYPDIPVGQVQNGVECKKDAIDYARIVCEMKNTDGNFLFKRSKPSNEGNPESTELYRRLLSQQPDNSVCIISVGFFTNLSGLLSTKADKYSPLSGKDLVAKKVKSLVVMAGDFREKNKVKEYNIFKDGLAAKKVFAEWPTTIVASPFGVGSSILYPATIIEQSFSWAGKHPLAEAYKSYQPMPYDRPTWDLTAVLYAVEPDAEYFNFSESGTITVDENNFTNFKPDPRGKHAYVSVTSEQAEKIKQRFIFLTTQKPLKAK